MTPKKDNAAPRRPIRRMVARTTLHARAASREEIDEFENEAEPGMKLSQAFIVVLILHIVAVGGIYAFNQIKSATKAPPVAKAPAVAPAEPIAKAAPLERETATAPALADTRTHTVVAGETLRRIAGKYGVNVASIEKANNLETNAIIRVGQVLAIPGTSSASSTAAPANQAAPAVVAKAPPVRPATTEKVVQPAPTAAPKAKPTATATTKTHIVAKGENPYSIAKKLNVNPIELMKANKIDDPRKLQIGQKLIVP